MKKFIGAELFFESLYNLGIRIIFGLPGGYVLKIYDVMPSYASKVKHILTRHEQAATHMADGFSRASGLPGIILCTSGPAATNTVTGISTAYMDSVPVLIFTGQVPTPFLGSDAFQEADHIGITRSCTKHNTLVRKTKDLPKAMAEALYISTTGRKGPVLVDMPKDVILGESDFKIPNKIKLSSYDENPTLIKRDLNSLKARLSKSKKPLLILGRGSCEDENIKNIKAFIRRFKIPTLTSVMALGLVEDSDYCFGMLENDITSVSYELIEQSDNIIVVGCDLNKIIPKAVLKNKKLTIVDIDKAMMNPTVESNLNIYCSSTSFFEKTKDELEPLEFEWEKEYLSKLLSKNLLNNKKVISKNKKAAIFAMLSELLKGEAVVCSDFSYEDVNLQKFIKFNNYKNNILSGGNGTPGYGFPAAIGAKFSRPKSKVISISSGNNFQFNMQEIIVALEQKLDLTIIVLNERFSDKKAKYKGPNFKSIGESFGAKSFQFNMDASLKSNLSKSLNRKGVVLIEVRI